MSSKQEMLKLAAQLQSLAMSSSSSKPKRNRRKKTKGKGAGPSVSKAGPLVVAPIQRPVKSNGNGSSMPNRNDGTIRIARTVKVGELKTDASGVVKATYPINLKDFTWVSKIANAYERVRFHKLGFSYRSCVGTNSSGLIAYGFDYDPDQKAGDRAAITALEPFVEVPIWSTPAIMMIPSNRLNAVQWYTMDSSFKAPGCLQVAVNCDKNTAVIGDMFCYYDVTFMGPVA